MKVSGPTVTSSPSLARPAAAPAASGFSVPGGRIASAANATPAAAMSGLSALVALQGVETATERRRRAVRRGRGMLDRLDALKLAVLAGETPSQAIADLRRSVTEEGAGDLDDDRLASVLAQIDLRAAVELEKAAMAGR